MTTSRTSSCKKRGGKEVVRETKRVWNGNVVRAGGRGESGGERKGRGKRQVLGQGKMKGRAKGARQKERGTVESTRGAEDTRTVTRKESRSVDEA
jgi:hypothetical protein